jgi:hypothetical protein
MKHIFLKSVKMIDNNIIFILITLLAIVRNINSSFYHFILFQVRKIYMLGILQFREIGSCLIAKRIF